jgi:hypothetical protein
MQDYYIKRTKGTEQVYIGKKKIPNEGLLINRLNSKKLKSIYQLINSRTVYLEIEDKEIPISLSLRVVSGLIRTNKKI